jgi:hypothetical protein
MSKEGANSAIPKDFNELIEITALRVSPDR